MIFATISKNTHTKRMASSSEWLKDLPPSLLEFKVDKKKNAGVDLSKPVNAVWTCCKGYIRCSTDMQLSNTNNKKKSKTEKNHFSLEVQEDLIQKEAVKLGLPLKKIFRDEAVSGSREDRNGLDEMIASLKRGDVLITVWLTRLTRGLQHFYDLVGNIHKKGIRIVSIRDDIDTSKPGFEQAMHLKAIFGNMERNITRARISDTLAYKRERGEHVGRVPYGKAIGPDGKLHDVPEKKEVINCIVDMRREGRTYRNIVEILEHRASSNDIYKLADEGDWTIRLVRSICIREMGETEARSSAKKRYITEDNVEESAESEEESQESEDEEDTQPATPSTPVVKTESENGKQLEQSYSLRDKPVQVLRVMLLKRKAEFMLSDEDVKMLSKEDILEILS